MMVALDDGPFVVGTMPLSIERALIPVLNEHRDSCVNYAELVEHLAIRVRFAATVEPEPSHVGGFFSARETQRCSTDGDAAGRGREGRTKDEPSPCPPADTSLERRKPSECWALMRWAILGSNQ
jgi:hypothetical protein